MREPRSPLSKSARVKNSEILMNMHKLIFQKENKKRKDNQTQSTRSNMWSAQVEKSGNTGNNMMLHFWTLPDHSSECCLLERFTYWIGKDLPVELIQTHFLLSIFAQAH